MKNINYVLLILFILLSINEIACKKRELSSKEGSEYKELELSANERDKKLNSTMQVEILEDFAGYSFASTVAPTTETGAETLLSTMQANSIDLLKNEIGMSDSELIDVYGSLNNPEIAYFGFMLNVIDVGNFNPQGGVSFCNPTNRIARCAVRALIPCNVLNVLSDLTQGSINGVAIRIALQGLSPLARKQMLEAIIQWGGRTAGFLYVSYAIWSFSDCVANGDIAGDNPFATLVEVSTVSNLIPNPLPNHSYWPTAAGAIDSVVDTQQNIDVFFNSADNKYYVDSAYTTIVPDGYYGSPPVIQYYRLHHIVNGSAIAVYELVPF